MEQKEEKQQLRKRIIEERQQMPAAMRASYSAQACRHLAASERLAQARAIMAFHPFGAELDILPFVQEAMARGQEIWLPLTISSGRRIVPYRYEGPHMLKQGVYGIWEPDPALSVAADLDRLDAVLVPGVAFDRQGGRMGYGGGYYDRFLAGLVRRPLLVGVAFAMQVVDAVPREPHDILLDGLVTESGFIQS
ncbi:5-formyltetrahydrofolate cyclo-ligase [Brevibacillus sp. GCM10020057]|uniref:5-formyltetrahydrofolate cyclo-ligase n=1 Tax=Brevibacillus sp. GCM10020057 TaxID=3317327 RepID=UPI003644A0F3